MPTLCPAPDPPCRPTPYIGLLWLGLDGFGVKLDRRGVLPLLLLFKALPNVVLSTGDGVVVML
jgi:hypothetical protein